MLLKSIHIDNLTTNNNQLKRVGIQRKLLENEKCMAY